MNSRPHGVLNCTAADQDFLQNWFGVGLDSVETATTDSMNHATNALLHRFHIRNVAVI